MRVLFCNIGWMKEYNGQTDKDRLVNGGKWVTENQDGGEVYNFKNLNGYYYGFVEHRHQMKIERFKGITPKDKKVEEVLVVWVAKDNKKSNKIVGWYKNAIVYREYNEFYTNNLERENVFYRIKANVFESTLLPIEERKFDIPRASKSKDGVGMGQANIWYADEEKSQSFVKKVIDYIEGYNGDLLNQIGKNDILELKCKEKSKDEEFYLDRVDDLMEEDKDLEAITYVNTLLDKDNNSVDGNNYKGIILKKLGFYDESIKYFKKASELNKEYSNPIFNIGKALSYKGDFEKSIEYLNKYIDLESEDVQGYEYKGLSLFHMYKYNEAKMVFKKAYKLEPEDEWYEYLCDLVDERLNNKIVNC